MGCDIHLWTETQQPDESWVCDQAATLEKEEDEGDNFIHWDMNEPYRGRNYVLFGLLADVRVDWQGLQFTQRGIPRDASPEYQTMCKTWGHDGHSHSYIPIHELKEKLMECMVSTEAMAAEAVPHLSHLLSCLKENVPDIDDEKPRRIVFFFDN